MDFIEFGIAVMLIMSIGIYFGVVFANSKLSDILNILRDMETEDK